MTYPCPRVLAPLLGCLLLTASVGAERRARAEGLGRVDRLLADVALYDIKGDRTFKALRRLEPHAEWHSSPRKQVEIGLVRATASIDLLLIATLTHTPQIRARLAATHDVSEEQLAAHIERMLKKVDVPTVARRVRDARAMLAMLKSGEDPEPDMVRDSEGDGADVVWLLVLDQRLNSQPSAMEALSPMANDPCAADDECDTLYSGFDVQGRRALAALARAARIARQVANPQTPSPLVVALRAQLKPAVQRIEDLEFAPTPKLSSGPACSGIARGGRASAPDVLAFVTGDAMHFGFAPRAQIGADGSVELIGLSEPRFPETTRIKLPSSYPQYLKRIKAVSTALSEVAQQGQNLTIGICASQDTPAHVWARAVLSARAAGFARPTLLAVGSDGGARSLDVDVVAARRADRVGPKELSVMVRIGGYSVRRGALSATIPRVQNEGHLSFDLGALVKHARPASVGSAKLHFMPDVASDTLLSTAFAIAPARDRLTVILP